MSLPSHSHPQSRLLLLGRCRWEDMGFIRANTRWPPALYEAMERFLAISPAR